MTHFVSVTIETWSSVAKFRSNRSPLTPFLPSFLPPTLLSFLPSSPHSRQITQTISALLEHTDLSPCLLVASSPCHLLRSSFTPASTISVNGRRKVEDDPRGHWSYMGRCPWTFLQSYLSSINNGLFCTYLLFMYSCQTRPERLK